MNRNYALLLLVCLLFAGSSSTMAVNNITVATIGTRPPQLSGDEDPQEMVDKMVEFWRGRLAQVLPHHPDLVVLPEACDRPSGLTREEQFKYFRARKDLIWKYLSGVAKSNNCYIAFGTKRQDQQGDWWNSCVVLDRQGETAGIYDKNFPTIGEMESGIMPGTEVPIIQCDFGTLACAICFDLNFAELRKRYQEQGPDIIVFPSMYHGGLVQSSWAYNCRSFFVSSCGFDDLPSEIRDPLGEVVAASTNYFHYAVATINLDCRLVHLDYNWEKLRAVKKKYGSAVTIRDPGRLGSVLLTSEHETISADQMIEEFGIELLDDYLARSRNFRQKKLD